MEPFLLSVVKYIKSKHESDLGKVCIVLPNKRASLYIKKYLFEVYQKAIWIPTIISSEELILRISGLIKLDQVDLLSVLYESYVKAMGEQAESFDKFSKWGNLMLQDFNELDRYLIDAPDVYENLSNIKEIENWSLSGEKLSKAQEDYLLFMSNISKVYKCYTETLLSENKGYQGLIYREASKKYLNHPYPNDFTKMYFCGLNAMNAAEVKIYKFLNNAGKAEFIWDADNYYLKDNKMEAGMFLRKHMPELSGKDVHFVGDDFKSKKDIAITSVAGATGQALAVRAALDDLLKQGVNVDSLAIVLANEKLLFPILKILPDEIKSVNISAEYPVKFTEVYAFIEQLITLQVAWQSNTGNSKRVFYKEILGVLSNPFFR
ncbi:MAG: hypothetical protein AB7O73_10900, partial [Bacteroidia bacterium]